MDALAITARRLQRTRQRKQSVRNLRAQIDELKEDMKRIEGLFANTAHERYSPRHQNGRRREDTTNTIQAPRLRAERVDQGGQYLPDQEWST